MIFPNEDIYEGFWVNGKAEGPGTLKQATGKVEFII